MGLTTVFLYIFLLSIIRAVIWIFTEHQRVNIEKEAEISPRQTPIMSQISDHPPIVPLTLGDFPVQITIKHGEKGVLFCALEEPLDFLFFFVVFAGFEDLATGAG